MTLAEAVSLTDKQVYKLMASYLSRKKFEAKITMSVVAQALKPQEKGLVGLGNLAALGIGVEGL